MNSKPRSTVPKYVASPMDRILLTSRLINPILLTDSLSNRSQSIGQQFNRLVSIVISKDAWLDIQNRWKYLISIKKQNPLYIIFQTHDTTNCKNITCFLFHLSKYYSISKYTQHEICISCFNLAFLRIQRNLQYIFHFLPILGGYR